MYIFFSWCARALSHTLTRTQFIEVDELDIRIYFTGFDNKMGSRIYVQGAHTAPPTQTRSLTNIYLNSILCGGLVGGAHPSPLPVFVEFVWFYSIVSANGGIRVHIRRAHLIRTFAVFHNTVFEPTCYMSDKIERRQKRKNVSKMVAKSACIIFSFLPRKENRKKEEEKKNTRNRQNDRHRVMAVAADIKCEAFGCCSISLSAHHQIPITIFHL